MSGFYTRPQREINITKIIFIAIFRNYAILSAIMAVNKKKDSFKVCNRENGKDQIYLTGSSYR